jgi:hypothetical protein
MTLAGVPGERTRPPARQANSIMLTHYAQGPRSPARERRKEKSQLQICHPFTAGRSHYKRRLVLCRRRLISLSGGVGTYTKLNLIRSNKRAGREGKGSLLALAFSLCSPFTHARTLKIPIARNSKITAGTERRREIKRRKKGWHADLV